MLAQVRNIALLIGAPPSRVAIFGEGAAAKGSFWNEETTSKEFAKAPAAHAVMRRSKAVERIFKIVGDAV